MPRKAQPATDFSSLLKGASFEDAPDVPAQVQETPKTIERAKNQESTGIAERANPLERTPLLERALQNETPATNERARTTESTTQPERFTFTHRVRITDGFQYRCTFDGVPDWADRNWLQYDGSPPKSYTAGPALYLPDGQICRVTDWLVQEDMDGLIRLVVYSDSEMQHFFSVVPA